MSDERVDGLKDHLHQALAAAVMMRDRSAQAGDSEGTHLALMTVAAINSVLDDLSMEYPKGSAQMLLQDGRPPVPGFNPS